VVLRAAWGRCMLVAGLTSKFLIEFETTASMRGCFLWGVGGEGNSRLSPLFFSGKR
jgi:hypothetical protein